ncbi:hypothetical protein LK12_07385 [Novosphingobium malaysiense]|uniref:Sugar transporter n=1 Tax=Novosphingobium malaysiense TaxID=1348853 RepID=A0A0B1ZQ83_9SPHN|nr:hypothetical protein LK12_07385 [Novosphingobium malaysiense]
MSFWIIAVLSLLWNAMGCADFTMTVTRNSAYLAGFTPEMINWLDSAPTWTLVPWALGVWGALAGSLFLLLRSRWAVAAFAASLIGLAVTQIWQFSSNMPDSMTAPGSVAFTVTIWIVAIALLWYSVRMRRFGVLR